MRAQTTVYSYINLGESLWFLQNPAGSNADGYSREISSFCSKLEACDLPFTRGMMRAIEGSSIPCNQYSRVMETLPAQQLALTMKAIRQALQDESSRKQTILLDAEGVSAQLRELATRLPLTPIQLNLLGETILCVECAAYRSAIVMGWNLAYDYIRQWLFDNHLAGFNTYLTANYIHRSGAPQYDPIVVYDDFFKRDAPGERVVLQSMNGANIIGGSVYDTLCHYLRNRNNYAHANSKPLSRDQTNSYIEHLISTIDEPPFKK